MSRFTAAASCLVSFFGIASLQLWASTSARADVIYEYTGNPFTFAPPWLPQGPGPPAPNPFTTDDFVSGSMTFANALPPDLPLQTVTPKKTMMPPMTAPSPATCSMTGRSNFVHLLEEIRNSR